MAQRINGFEQIKGFYSWAFENQDLGVKPQHVSIYLFLINQNNRNNWIEWFKLPYDLAMAGSCISSKKTYYACLHDLQNWGLIQYKAGVNNWKAPLIKLEVLKDTSNVPQSEPQPIQATTPQHIQALIQAAEPQPIPNIKLLTYNLKLITDNLQQVLSFLGVGVEDKNLEEKKDVAPKKLELEKAIALQFGLNEIAHFRQISTIKAFVNVTSEKFGFDHVVKTITDYLVYKEKSGSIKFQFKNFIGTPEEHFADGGWNSNNWEHLMINNNGSKQTTPDAKRASRYEVANKLGDMLKGNTGE